MKILVIRFLAIGDVVLTSSLCSSLRESFPEAQIDYLMHAASGPLFELHPHIDNVLTLSQQERKNPFKYLRRAWSISRTKYDIIIDATSTEKSQFISLFSPACKYRIGRAKPGKGFAFTHKIPPSEFTGDKISQRMRLLEPLAQAGFNVQYVPRMSLHYSDAEKNVLKQRMLEQGISFDRPVFAFSVSSKKADKKWPLDRMVKVIEHCINKYAVQILVFGGMPHERPDQEQIYRDLNQHQDIFINVESKSLRELGALLCLCDIFIGNEGGPRHMAHAVGVPSATVFSPSSRTQEWLPEKGDMHDGVEWQDVVTQDTQLANGQKANADTHFRNGDETYFELYELIESDHFIALIDRVIDSSGVLKSSAS